jgi:8-oxo-dGTP pyrophosphatase MutT (NUDIX family)
MPSSVRFQWVEDQVPSGSVVTQVYGFCFAEGNRILVLRDGECFNLPGGKPEPGETYAQTLQREAEEEASAMLGNLAFLGYQLVTGVFIG